VVFAVFFEAVGFLEALHFVVFSEGVGFLHFVVFLEVGNVVEALLVSRFGG